MNANELTLGHIRTANSDINQMLCSGGGDTTHQKDTQAGKDRYGIEQRLAYKPPWSGRSVLHDALAMPESVREGEKKRWAMIRDYRRT